MVSDEGETRIVTQMQMIVWPDLEAPEDARYNLTVLILIASTLYSTLLGSAFYARQTLTWPRI